MMGDGPNANAKHSKYSIEDGKLVRGEHCPYCGPGIFLAVHNNRMASDPAYAREQEFYQGVALG